MGIDDKFDNAKDDAVGHAKEKYGKATGDEDTEAEGKTDQAKAKLKKAGENVKDAFR